MNLKTFWLENVYWPIRNRFILSELDAFDLGAWATSWHSLIRTSKVLVVSVSHGYEEESPEPPRLYIFVGRDVEGLWSEFVEGAFK